MSEEKKKKQTEKARAVANELDKEQRKNLVTEKYEFTEQLFLKGWKALEIKRAFALHFDNDVRTAQNYLTKVQREYRKEKIGKGSESFSLNKSLARWEMMYRMAIEKGDLAQAEKMQNKIDELSGVKQATKFIIENNIKQTNTHNHNIDLTALPEAMLNQLLQMMNGNTIDITPDSDTPLLGE